MTVFILLSLTPANLPLTGKGVGLNSTSPNFVKMKDTGGTVYDEQLSYVFIYVNPNIVIFGVIVRLGMCKPIFL
jgi:hypothetical protein|tara:strand:- start:3228 stop:3449 length:222 start_codon:yes stop_codon:yes gene_type:complete